MLSRSELNHPVIKHHFKNIEYANIESDCIARITENQDDILYRKPCMWWMEQTLPIRRGLFLLKNIHGRETLSGDLSYDQSYCVKIRILKRGV